MCTDSRALNESSHAFKIFIKIKLNKQAKDPCYEFRFFKVKYSIRKRINGISNSTVASKKKELTEYPIPSCDQKKNQWKVQLLILVGTELENTLSDSGPSSALPPTSNSSVLLPSVHKDKGCMPTM